METVGLIEGSQSGLKAEAKDGFPKEITAELGLGGILSGVGCCTLQIEGKGGRGGWAFFWRWGHGGRDLESPPELLCAGWWKREILGSASEYGERQ